ncbi:nuclear transport factor 2 family protein [Spirosoma arcticum]
MQTFLLPSLRASVAGLLTLMLFGTQLMSSAQTPSTTTNPNVALIQRYYQVYAQGDPQALRPFFAPNIEYRIPGHGPLAGTKRGVDEVLAFFAELAKGGFRADPIVLAQEGDWVIDLHRGYSTLGVGQVDITWALAFRIQNGQIVEAINFAFDQAAADIYWWANYPLKPIPDRLLNPSSTPTTALSLTAPTYNCTTGAIRFNTAGGNGSPIEYAAAGITVWTTNPNQFVEAPLRTANDVQPFTLQARQNGQVVSYTWDLRAACGRGRLGISEPATTLGVTVLGNPTSEAVTVDINGVEGQPLTLRLTNARGHLIENRTVQQTRSIERQTFDLRRQPSGLLLLQAITGQGSQTVKVVKP